MPTMENASGSSSNRQNGYSGSRSLSRERQGQRGGRNRRQASSQKKTKAKQKMREVSRRAESRDTGSDMDAFVDARPVTDRPPVPPPAAAPAPAPAPAAKQAEPAPPKPQEKRESPAPVPSQSPAPVPAPTQQAEPPKQKQEPPEQKLEPAKPTAAAPAAVQPPPVAAPAPAPAPAPVPAAEQKVEPAKPPAQPQPQTQPQPAPSERKPEVRPEQNDTDRPPEPSPTPPADTKPPTDKKPEPAAAAAEPEPVKPTAAAAEPEQQSSPAPEPAPAAAAQAQTEELEEGEIRDVEGAEAEAPTVNGTDGAKSEWQLKVEKMKEEFLSIGHKKQYGRDDLIRLQGHPLSLQRPLQLPDLPSIVRKDRSAGDARTFAAIKSRSMGPTTGGPDFGASFIKPATRAGGRYGGRGSQQGRREMQQQPQPRRVEIILNRDVKLKESENAWKASYKKPKAAAGEESEDESIIKAFKGILNKITPSNVERLIESIKKQEWTTPERLRSMIDVLFTKAVDEPTYADQYAKVCQAMAKTEAVGEDAEGKKVVVVFRKMLLQQCQAEFEKDKTAGLDREARLAEIEKETDEQVKKEKMFLLEEQERKVRRRSNGNIRFIGELYKLGMLTDRIMHQCIVKLLQDKHEDSYECLCKLVTTIGQKLEEAEISRGKHLQNQFDEFARLAKDKSLSSRIRFMLQDMIDLRNDKWVNKRVAAQSKPMTIQEIHKQARQEQIEQQIALAQVDERRRSERGGDRRRGGRDGGGRDGGRAPPSADGWNTAGSNRRFDPSRFMIAVNSGSNNRPEAEQRLGPGGGMWSFGSKVGRGAGAAAAGPPGAGDVRTTPNMFSLLRDDQHEPPAPPVRLGPQGPGRRGASGERPGGRPGPPPPAAAPAPVPVAPPRAAAASAQLKGDPNLDNERMKTKVHAIIDELNENKDFQSALEDCEGLLHEKTMSMFVTESLNTYVDARSTEQRHITGELHRHLLEKGYMSAGQYLAGAADLLEFAIDLACDIPSVWKNLAELLAPPLTSGSPQLTLASLVEPAGPIVEGGCGGKFVIELLKRLVSLGGPAQVSALVPGNFSWSVFFGPSDHVQPLVNAQLGFLVSGASVPLPPEALPPSNGVRSLLKAIRQEADLSQWLERKISPKDRQDPQFVRDFVAALCFDAIVIEKGLKKVVHSRLEKHASLLKCLIVNVELEVAALFGLQGVITHLEYPPGVLDQFFRQLYDMEVISEQAFLQWRDDPSEQEGKGVATMSVQSFFKALQEEDEEGDRT